MRIILDLKMAAHQVPEVQDDCPIYFSELTPEKQPSIIEGYCDHKFCSECLVKWVKNGGEQVIFFKKNLGQHSAMPPF